ncbi:hypothetical protein [Priestia megaterium]|uniref:hypothetical protein n=1 Tax=Priestia megaterium TaxID=1404 RepID=UPI0028773E96|nr:hypothetical protein [Priestia megaterium]
MKKLLMVLASASLLALAACGGAEESQETSGKAQQEEKKPTKAEQKEVSNKPEKDEDGNMVFTKVGQKAKTPDGTIELLKIKDVNQTVNVAPLTVTVDKIKLFKVTNPSADFVDTIDMQADEKVGDSFTYMQVTYAAENPEEKNIQWYSINKLVLSNGQQIDGISKDFIYDDADEDDVFYGKVKKDYVDAFVVKDENIDNVKLIFAETLDDDSYDTITPEVQSTFELQ